VIRPCHGTYAIDGKRLYGAATTTNVSLFVERNSAAGFYTIAILVTEI